METVFRIVHENRDGSTSRLRVQSGTDGVIEAGDIAMANPQQYFVEWRCSYGVKPAGEQSVRYV